MKRRISKSLVLKEEEVLLAKERTILSFMQTGLAFIGLGLIVTNFLKEADIRLVGFVLIIVGFVEVLESIRRLRKKQSQMHKLKKMGAI